MQKEVTIIDYGLGNIKSLYNAFEYLGAKVNITNEISKIKKSKKIILPGVGSFDAGMNLLNKKNIVEILNTLVIEKKIPFLGICLGMQFLMDKSEEGNNNGFGWIKGICKKFDINNNKLPVPHIGWSKTNIYLEGKIFESLGPESYFYFVHSFYIPSETIKKNNPKSLTNYGSNFLSAFEIENIWACQFHPEKSQMAGLKLLSNFLRIN